MRVDSSAQGAISVTPSDTVNITFPSGTNYSKGIYVGVSGDLKVIMVDGTNITFTNIAAGIFQPISAKRVLSTGTTATGIVAVY